MNDYEGPNQRPKKATVLQSDGVRDALSYALMRLAGRPAGTIACLFLNDFDEVTVLSADTHGWDGDLTAMRNQARHATGVIVIVFDDDQDPDFDEVTWQRAVETGRVLSGTIAITLALPSVRVVVAAGMWAEILSEGRTSDPEPVEELHYTPLAAQAVLAGLPFPSFEASA